MIWSPNKKIVIILELGVPWEENVVASHVRKQARYDQLQAGLQLRGWRVVRLEFEVGSRGYLSTTVSTLWKALGLTQQEAKSAKSRMTETALLCSYVIFSARTTSDWRQQRLMGLHLISEGGDETRDVCSTTVAAATAAAEQVLIPSSPSDGDNGDGNSNSGNESGRNSNNGSIPDNAVRRRRSARSPAASTIKDAFRTFFKDVRSKIATSQKPSLPHGGAPTV